MKVNGVLVLIKEMEKANNFGMMVPIMKAIGTMGKLKTEAD